jgi:hypothetical protein
MTLLARSATTLAACHLATDGTALIAEPVKVPGSRPDRGRTAIDVA